uniref:Uncharacterized protein n=1 Tax=Oryza nivara TaxID=4536 RepID=A0A0E0GRB9_ORYNI
MQVGTFANWILVNKLESDMKCDLNASSWFHNNSSIEGRQPVMLPEYPPGLLHSRAKAQTVLARTD